MCVSATVNGSEAECEQPLEPAGYWRAVTSALRRFVEYRNPTNWLDGHVSSMLCFDPCALSRDTHRRGFGRQMTNTPMVIMWPNPDGSVTLSQRSTLFHTMPSVDANPPRVATPSKALSSVRLCLIEVRYYPVYLRLA